MASTDGGVKRGTRDSPVDRHQLVNRGAGSGHFRPVAEAEIEARKAAVRAVKRAANGVELTPEELDLILDPVNCRRTRIRLLGRS